LGSLCYIFRKKIKWGFLIVQGRYEKLAFFDQYAYLALFGKLQNTAIVATEDE